MPDYKEMYFDLMRSTEKSIRALEQAVETLKEAQLRCEERYLESTEEENKEAVLGSPSGRAGGEAD